MAADSRWMDFPIWTDVRGPGARNCLLLVAWSASFIELAIGRLWPWDPCMELLHTNRKAVH